MNHSNIPTGAHKGGAEWDGQVQAASGVRVVGNGESGFRAGPSDMEGGVSRGQALESHGGLGKGLVYAGEGGVAVLGMVNQEGTNGRGSPGHRWPRGACCGYSGERGW